MNTKGAAAASIVPHCAAPQGHYAKCSPSNGENANGCASKCKEAQCAPANCDDAARQPPNGQPTGCDISNGYDPFGVTTHLTCRYIWP